MHVKEAINDISWSIKVFSPGNHALQIPDCVSCKDTYQNYEEKNLMQSQRVPSISVSHQNFIYTKNHQSHETSQIYA